MARELQENIQLIYNSSGFLGGARGVMVIVIGIGHGDTSSNPGLIAFGKGMNPNILPPAMGK